MGDVRRLGRGAGVIEIHQDHLLHAGRLGQQVACRRADEARADDADFVRHGE
jgi:hypothetical protein